MEYVICDEVSEGLRPSEVTVGVKSFQGRREYLRVSQRSLRQRDEHFYLAVGVVRQDRDTGAYLVEFPHEADSGTSRVWVPQAALLDQQSNGVHA